MGADLSGSLTGQAIAITTCTSNGTCVGDPNLLGTQWISLFVEKNTDFDLNDMTHTQFDELFHLGQQQFSSLIGSDDPDLSGFNATGGKIIAQHGLVCIFPPL